MNKSFLLISFFALTACSNEPSTDELSVEQTMDHGSEAYDDVYAHMQDLETDPSVQINEANAMLVTSHENTPESVAAFFYASIIRKDLEWQQVCPPFEEQTQAFKTTVEQYNTWRSLTYTPQSTYISDVMFRLDFTDMNNQHGHGERVITVEETDGKYLITSIPAF